MSVHQTVVVRVRADPEPLQAIPTFNRQSPVASSHAYRPKIAVYPLEVQRWVLWVALKQRKALVRLGSRTRREGIVEWLKFGVLEMPHEPNSPKKGSEIFSPAGLMVGADFYQELVELSGFGVPRNPAIENTRVEFLEPPAKLCQFLRRQTLDGLLDIFNLGHSTTVPSTS